MNSNKMKRGIMSVEEQLLLKEMHMKNSITITPSKSSTRYEKKYVEPVRLTPAWEEKNLPNDVLNFKSVTMEQAELETNPPKDRFLIVYFIILIHGIGILMPWNMFITAKSYFVDYKLNSNYTITDYRDLRDYFMPFLGLFSQVPSLIFNWLNVFINFGGSLTSRIVYSIVVEVIIFICTEIFVLLDTSKWAVTFFWITMATVVILNIANGIYQNTIYGIAARLPARYTGAVILGSNISGVFTAITLIISKYLAPSPRTAAVYYFIVALFVLFICFDTYFVLPLTKFYKFHDLLYEKAKQKAVSIAQEANKSYNTSYWKVFKSCSLQCFNAFFIFFITLAIYPSVHANIKPLFRSSIFPEDYFTEITCFLTFNLFATFGNLVANVITFPGPRRLHYFVLLRIIFVPLFLICNYQTSGRIMPVLIKNDYIYCGIAVLFAFTSGYYSSLAMMYCGKTVAPEDSSVAAMFGAACLITGICSGIAVSFVFPYIVNNVSW